MMDLTNVVVHCPTEELAKKVLAKANGMEYKWKSEDSFLSETYWGYDREGTCYWIEKGLYGYLDWFKKNDYKIISAEDFLKEPVKVYYRGDKKRGAEIINALERLRGSNNSVSTGLCEDCIYFINDRNLLDWVFVQTEWLLKQAGYTEAHLPPICETITIGEHTYDKEEFENAVKNLKTVK